MFFNCTDIDGFQTIYVIARDDYPNIYVSIDAKHQYVAVYAKINYYYALKKN